MTTRRAPLPAPDPDEVRERGVLHEYSQFVAVEVIEHNGVRAYNPGDPVPAANVQEYDYLTQGLVAAIGDPAAVEAKARAAQGSGQ